MMIGAPEKMIQINLQLTPNMLNACRARAWDLRCGANYGVSTLIRDIIQAWLASTTNWEDPKFHTPIHIEPVTMPRERFDGYLAALGFVD